MNKSPVIGLCMMLLIIGFVSATNYYYNSTTGSDANDCLTPTTACKTLADLQSYVVDQNSTIFFNGCEEPYRGAYGRDKYNTNYTSYGGCGRAKIYGSINASLSTYWTSIGGNMYESQANYTNDPNMIYYDANKIDQNLAVMAKRNTSGTIDEDWEYYWNSTSKKVKLYLSTGNPGAVADGIEIPAYNRTTTYNPIFAFATENKINITKLTFAFAIGGAIRCYNVDNCYINDNEFKYIYTKAISTELGDNSEISNNTFYRCGVRGISYPYGVGAQGENIFNYRDTNLLIDGNTIEKCGGVCINPLSCVGLIISNNKVFNSEQDYLDSVNWAAGIYPERCNNTLITRNNVSDTEQGIMLGSEATPSGSNNVTISYNIAWNNTITNMLIDTNFVAESITNINITHNTFIKSRHTNGSGYGNEVDLGDYANVSFMDNIVYNDYSDTHSGQLMFIDNGTNYGSGFSSDYNLWYSLSAFVIDFDGTDYTSLAAYTAAKGFEANGVGADPLFVTGTYQPSSGSPACTMSSTGSYIGAIPCGDPGDITSPIINIINSSFNTTDQTPTIWFNFTDSESSTANCTLIQGYIPFAPTIDHTENDLNNNTLLNITIGDDNKLWTQGVYETYINCTDESNNKGKSNTINITFFDTQSPDYVFISYYNTDYSNYNFTLIVEAFDIGASIANCTMYFNNTLVSTINSPVESPQTFYFSANIENVSSGNYSVHVNCTDSYNNIKKSSSINTTINDTDEPTVYLQQPYNATQITNISQRFFFYFKDSSSTRANCSLYVNNVLFDNNASTNNHTSTFFYHPTINLSDGINRWNITCKDEYGGNTNHYHLSDATGANTSNFIAFVDGTAPTTTIINNSITLPYSQRNINISFKMTDRFDLGVNSGVCYLLVNGSIVNNRTYVYNNTVYGLNYTFTNHTNNVYVSCSDNTIYSSGNRGNSSSINVTLTPEILITNPTNGSNTSLNYINITYNYGPFDYHENHYFNISLLNSDGSFNATIIDNNSINQYYYWEGILADYSPGTYIIKVEANNNTNQTFTSVNVTYNIVTDAILNISAIGGVESLTNFTISTSLAEVFNVTDGSLIIGIFKNYTYNITISNTGYAIQTYTGNWSNDTNNLIFDLNAPANSIYITFKDSFNLSVLSGINISLDYIGDSVSNSKTTDTGYMNITGLYVEDYVLRYYANDYNTRFYSVSVGDQSTQNLTLYMILGVVSRNITITVIDQNANPVEGAVVKALKYDLSTNTYLLQETSNTNLEGEVIMSLSMYDEYYKFMVEYGGVLKTTTTPAYITSNSLVVQIILGGSITTDYDNYMSLYTHLEFNNDTNNFRLDYSDTNGILSQVCVEVYTRNARTQTLISRTCSSSASATILSPVTPTPGATYTAEAYYVTGSSSLFLDSLSHTYTNPEVEVVGPTYGLFLQLLLTCVMAFIAVWSIPLASIAVPLSLIIGKMLNLNFFGWDAIAALTVAGIIIAYLTRKDNG